MGVLRVPRVGKATLYVKTGELGTGGAAKTVTRTFTGVRSVADDQDIFDVMQILGGLYEHGIQEYVLVELNEMISV